MVWFTMGEEIAKYRAEDGEGHEDDAEGLFGTFGGLSTLMTSAAS